MTASSKQAKVLLCSEAALLSAAVILVGGVGWARGKQHKRFTFQSKQRLHYICRSWGLGVLGTPPWRIFHCWREGVWALSIILDKSDDDEWFGAGCILSPDVLGDQVFAYTH